MKKLLKQIKTRWDIEDYHQLTLILIVFSIAGLTALYVRTIAFEWMGFNQQTPLWEEAVAWVVFVIPSYHIVLLLYGFILGQFDFFWRFQRENFVRVRDFLAELPSKF